MTSEENNEKEENEQEILREISSAVKSIDDKVDDIRDIMEKHFEDLPRESDNGYDFNDYKDFYHENNGYGW